MKRLELILIVIALAFLPMLVKAEEKADPLPHEYSVKDTEATKDHLDRIVDQVTGSKRSVALGDKATTLAEAHKLLLKAIAHPKKIPACVEFKGWFIFSTMESTAEAINEKDTRSLALVFHQGYGVKKGSDQAFNFGFW